MSYALWAALAATFFVITMYLFPSTFIPEALIYCMCAAWALCFARRTL